MTTFLTPDAINTIKCNLDSLVRASNEAKLRHMKPTTDDRKDILDTILDFVRTRKRIVYGGYAVNSALSVVSPDDMIYTSSNTDCNDPSSVVDIEFYSPTPIEDTMHICSILHSRNHEYVRGKEAMHNNTFTISVEFVRVCDVTFIPEAVYYSIPHMIVNNCLVVHPLYAMIDMLRMLCDPFNSHWRLTHTIDRIDVIQRCFSKIGGEVSTNTKVSDHPSSSLATASIATKTARHLFASMPLTTAAVGDCAFAHYSNKVDLTSSGPLLTVSVISTCFERDALELMNRCNAACGPVIEWSRYHPLLELLEERIEGSIDGRVIITLFMGSQTVPSCGCSDIDGMRIASFTQSLLTARSMHMWHISQGTNVIRVREYESHIRELLLMRELSTLCVLDKTNPMREFYLEFIGTPQRTMRTHMKKTDERMSVPLPPRDRKDRKDRNHRHTECAWFSFDPKKTSAEQMRFLCRRTFPKIDGSKRPVPPFVCYADGCE
jgi:hypothetical protein